jgi:hypothetical protein
MIRKLGLIFIGLVVLMLLSPMFIYWWGLSNLETDPVPSQIRLTSEQEQQIWSKEKGLFVDSCEITVQSGCFATF